VANRRLLAGVGFSIVVAAAVAAAVDVPSQPRRRSQRFAMRPASAHAFDGSFNFCRIMFNVSGDGDGGRWSVDYPRADINLSIRLSELTKTPVSFDGAGEPNHLVLRLTDDELFQCPFVMMTEVGAAHFDEDEAARLRTYLLKGGFLWVDDFWGTYAWEVWAREFHKVFPPSEYQVVDLPQDHPLLRVHFPVPTLPQIPSINHWAWSGGTSERGADSAEPHLRGIADRHGRLMVLMTHNTDLGDSWEREADDPQYFYRFSVDGYAFGINVLLYAMTH
jgi:hypothetical protein